MLLFSIQWKWKETGLVKSSVTDWNPSHYFTENLNRQLSQTLLLFHMLHCDVMNLKDLREDLKPTMGFMGK